MVKIGKFWRFFYCQFSMHLRATRFRAKNGDMMLFFLSRAAHLGHSSIRKKNITCPHFGNFIIMVIFINLNYLNFVVINMRILR